MYSFATLLSPETWSRCYFLYVANLTIMNVFVCVAQPGMLVVGVLKRKMDYGIFVNMLNNLTGLAPNKVLCSSSY